MSHDVVPIYRRIYGSSMKNITTAQKPRIILPTTILQDYVMVKILGFPKIVSFKENRASRINNVSSGGTTCYFF